MVNLEELRIDANGISSLPASLAKLRALKKLYLCKNKLKQLPAEIGKMGKLECLFADENELEAIPEEIGTLKGLEWLDLMGNRLRELPESLGKLKKLQSLELGNNQFKRIPDPVLALKGLNFLGVGGNPLDALPDLRGLKKLEELDISDTKLDPGDVAGLVGPEVEIIKIPGNFEADLPPMVRRMGWAMCGDWFLSNPDADPEEYPQLIKTLREKWKPRPIVES